MTAGAEDDLPPSASPGGRHPPTAMWGDPRSGAALVAPTAPHATESVDGRARAGPARFWAGRWTRVVLSASLVFSLGLHAALSPWRLLPDRSALEMKEVEGELTIPLDLLGEAPAPPPVAPEPATTTDEGATARVAKPDAGARVARDASTPDAMPLDTDGGVATAELGAGDLDAGAMSDAGSTADGSALDADGGAIAAADGSAPVAGPRDPASIIGMSGLVTAGQVNVTMLVNMAVIRQSAVGARAGPLLFSIPQWKDFLSTAQGSIDPVRDTDWILIYGPSLINTSRDAILVRYSTSDEIVDRAVEAIANRYDKGGAFDAGVPGVKASIAHADGAERVVMRVQPHVLTVVPKDKAAEFAKALRRAPIAPKVRPGEAFRLVMKDPSKQLRLPGVKFDESVKELRLWVTPRASDGGADLHLEGDCTDDAAAAEAADALNAVLKRQNTIMVRALTRGLLNNAKVTPDGARIKLDLVVTPEQLEALLQAVGAAVGAQVAPAAAGGGSGE